MQIAPLSAEARRVVPAAFGWRLAPVVTAALLGVAIAMAAWQTPGPAWFAVGLAAFVSLAVFFDVRERRIPNALTLPALAAGLAVAWATAGGAALAAALLGAGLGLGALLPLYALGVLGAGDVKAAAALGAMVGAAALAEALLWALGVGGVLGLGWIALRGELRALLARWGRIVWLSALRLRPAYVPPPAGSAATEGIPFAVALAIGLVLAELLGSPW